MSQSDKAAKFRSLHVKGDPIILYNIWDVVSAKAVEAAGAPALATGSKPVAVAQGFEDGENIPFDLFTGIVERIAKSTDLPLSVDFESGFARSSSDISKNAKRLIEAGAIGFNFEDQIIGENGLYSIEEQTARIEAVRRAGVEANINIVLNARTDLFLKSERADHAKHIDEAIERGKAYYDAGADSFFVPGLVTADLVKTVVDAVDLPVNVIPLPGSPDIREFAELGVGRISHGPIPQVQLMEELKKRAAPLYSCA